MPHERPIALLASASMAFALALAYPVEPILVQDAPAWIKATLAAVVFVAAFALLLPVWLPALVPSHFPRLTSIARLVGGALLVLVGLAAIFYAMLVAGPRLYLVLLGPLCTVAGAWHLKLASSLIRQR